MFPDTFSRGTKSNYAHRILPLLVQSRPAKFYEYLSHPLAEWLLSKIWHDLEGNEMSLERPPSLSLSRRVLSDDTEAFVVHLPEPTRSPEAFMVAMVFRVMEQSGSRKAKSVRYFTLEMGPELRGWGLDPSLLDLPEPYVFCEWVGGETPREEHRNYGTLPDKSEETFLAAIRQLI